MILYVNGNGLTAGERAVNNYRFANDDFTKVALGRKPHPDNLAVSWGMQLSKILQLALVCDAESDSSNDRIMRTTREFLKKLPSMESNLTYVVIGWSDWTSEEWWDDEAKEYVQVSVTGASKVPDKWKTRYAQYVKSISLYEKMQYWHEEIYELHFLLKNLEIPHLFFNASYAFSNTAIRPRSWDGCYLDPYHFTFDFGIGLLTKKEHAKLGRIDQEAHTLWANYLFTCLTNLHNNV